MRRVKYWGALAVLMALSASTALATEDFKKIDEKEAAALAVYAPRPPYPYEARAQHQQGSGIAILKIDPATGYVTNAEMVASTGVPTLDDAAVSTLRRWRFQSGIVSKVRIPITFYLSGGRGFSIVAEVHVVKAPRMDQVLAPFLGKENVIKAPMPVYPAYPPWTRKEGRGVYELDVNQAGMVTEVKILKASGDPTFDGVTVNTLHQWRLRHGPKIIELPLAFVMTPDNCRVWIP